MEVPSIKLNWRGTTLNQKLLISLITQKNGVLETMINTNATQLDTKMSKKLISRIRSNNVSFDGSKKTYDK